MAPPPPVSIRQLAVLGSCFAGLSLAVPPLFLSTLPVLLIPICKEFGWSRTAVTAGFSLALFAAASSPLMGALVDRFGPRRVLLAATPVLAGGLLSLSALPAVYPLYLSVALLLGLSGAAINLSYLSLLPRWFDGRLGLSMGMAMTGTGLGYAVWPLAAQRLVEVRDWRFAYLVFALAVMIAAYPCIIGLVRDRPQVQGVGAKPLDRALVEAGGGVSFGQALRTPLLWAFALSIFAIMAAVSACGVQLVPMMLDRGIPARTAAGLASVLGASILVARIVAGLLLDRTPAWLLASTIYLGVALGAVILAIGGGGRLLIILGVIFVGAGQGVEGDVLPYMTRRFFGVASFGKIFGFLTIAYAFGAMIGPLVSARVFDTMGRYTWGLYLAAGGAILAALLVIFVVRPLGARGGDLGR